MGSQRLIRLAVVALLATLAVGCRGNEGPDGDATSTSAAPSGRHEVVEWVNDGDTLTLENGAKVRLVQVDAPELHSDCYGRAALQALIGLAPKGARVTVVRDPRLDERDQHGRLLRYVFVGSKNVNVELVRLGAASPYFFRNARGRYADALLDAVEKARDARRGYWGACSGAELNTAIGSVTGPA